MSIDTDELMRLHAAASPSNASQYTRAQFTDAAHAAVPELVRELERLEALCQQTHGVHHSWVATVQERDALKAEYEAAREQLRANAVEIGRLHAVVAKLETALGSDAERKLWAAEFPPQDGDATAGAERDALKAELDAKHAKLVEVADKYRASESALARYETEHVNADCLVAELNAKYGRLEQAARGLLDKLAARCEGDERSAAAAALRAALGDTTE
jgi:uncharacterized coiled-coil DUF342 family protein